MGSLTPVPITWPRSAPSQHVARVAARATTHDDEPPAVAGCRGHPDTQPAWATQPVHVVEHDPAWAGLATRFADEVRALFAGRLSGPVLHVGSTSVPGLPAKPVIDLQAVSPDPAAALTAAGEAANAAGWMVVPRELDRRPWRWLLVRVSDDGRSRLAHLHLMPPGQERWAAQLLFRDRLRASPRLRTEYTRIKRRAAADHPDDREAYGRAKEEFVRRVVAAG